MKKNICLLIFVFLLSLVISCDTDKKAHVLIDTGFSGSLAGSPAIDISSMELTVTRSSGAVSTYDVESTTGQIELVLNVGTYTFELNAPVVANSTSIFAYRGYKEATLSPGSNLIALYMIPGETKLLIPDYKNARVVQVDDFGNSSITWAELTLMNISDCDIDGAGNIYGATLTGVEVASNIADSEPEGFSEGVTDCFSVAVDHVNNYLYYGGNRALYRKGLASGSSQESLDLSSVITNTSYTITGIAVDLEGFVYLVAIYNKVYKVAIDSTGTVSLVASTDDENIDAPWDVMFKDNVLYVTDLNQRIIHRVNSETMARIDSYPELDGTSPFRGPRRFVAPYNREVYFIDEDNLDDDRLVRLNDISTGDYDTYGSHGSEIDQFFFFAGLP